MKFTLEWLYVAARFGGDLVRGRNPIKTVTDYSNEKRGMNWRTDVKDWLGGYPYEFATVEEVFLFMKREFPEFRLVNLKTQTGTGNNWYLFRRE